MFEILIRIESLCLGKFSRSPAGMRTGDTDSGIFLWLAGSHYSAVILGLLGAVVGSAIGLLVSQWLDTPALTSMLMGALFWTLAAVLFRNVLIILLAWCCIFSGGSHCLFQA